MAARFITYIALGLASLQAVTAAPAPAEKVYPEVIPGPGLPSLASLGLTSKQLYEMPLDMSPLESYSAKRSLSILEKRFDPRCGPSEAAYTNVNGIIACFHYLRNLGTQRCEAPGNFGVVEMCRSGDAHVQGQSMTGRSAASYCSDVALGVLWTIDHCTRADQSCAGFAAANGNGDLVVGGTHVRW